MAGSSGGSTPSQTFTLTNSNMVKADGGQLYIIDEQIANTGTLEAVNHGTLKLTGLTVTNTDPLGAPQRRRLGRKQLDARPCGRPYQWRQAWPTPAQSIRPASARSTPPSPTPTASKSAAECWTLSGSITGSGGSVTIDASATLDLASSFVDSHDVTFAGSGR